jgi:hypothetical protein
VNNLKFRYSYGFVGNDRIGGSSARFFYLSEINPRDANKSAVFGTDMNSSLGAGWTIKRYANPSVTWERSIKQNYAIEIGVWNKLSIVAEYFSEYLYRIAMGDDLSDAVDFETLGNVAWSAPNEWLAYTVIVQDAGVYEFDASLVVYNNNNNVHLIVDGLIYPSFPTLNNRWIVFGWYFEANALEKPTVNLTAGKHQIVYGMETAATQNILAFKFIYKGPL